MIVATKAYGQIEVDEKQKVTFPEGIRGFEKFTEYVLLDAEKKPFYYLQSVEATALAFILIDPFIFRPDYQIDVDDEVLKEKIGLTNPEDALVFAIVTAPGEGEPVTANLLGPLVINKSNRNGFQAILMDQRWQVKHDIMSELAKARG